MKLVVQTQYIENYGDETNPCWKAKGGDEYLVATLTADEAAQLGHKGLRDLAFAEAEKKGIVYSNIMADQSVVDWSLEEDTYRVNKENTLCIR